MHFLIAVTSQYTKNTANIPRKNNCRIEIDSSFEFTHKIAKYSAPNSNVAAIYMERAERERERRLRYVQ